jgi:hypothetical protein
LATQLPCFLTWQCCNVVCGCGCGWECLIRLDFAFYYIRFGASNTAINMVKESNEKWANY